MHKTSNHRDHSELTAKLVAALVTFGCLCFFALVAQPESQSSRPSSPAPAATPRPSLEPPPPPVRIDANEQFLAVPGRWAAIDFKHHAYGPYRFYGGKRLPLILKNGEYPYDFGDDGRGWFSLNAVYYFDVTGDLIPDAIVDLSHVECGYGSCDGGAHLLFIYSINAEGQMKKLFQYETGSYAYGCGLKSMTLERKQVRLEVFGRCPRPGMEDTGPGKGMVEDLTQLVFWFSNKGFIRTKTDFISLGLRDVSNYRADIQIKAEPANVIRP